MKNVEFHPPRVIRTIGVMSFSQPIKGWVRFMFRFRLLAFIVPHK